MGDTTLGQLKIGLRTRVGEVLGNLIGDVRYAGQEEASGTVAEETTDELGQLLNDAQRFVARDIYHKETYKFKRLNWSMRVISAVQQYTLPEDCIVPTEVWHVRGQGNNRRLLKTNISEIRSPTSLDPGRTYGSAGYMFYDVDGLDSTYIALGTISQAHGTDVVDNLRPFNGVRLGDTVYNLTDGSQGEVIAWSDQFVRVRELAGGRVNTFRVGDDYGVATREQDRNVLHVYPPIDAGEKVLLNSNTPDDMQLQASDECDTVEVYFESLPSDYQGDERLTFRFVNYFEGNPLTPLTRYTLIDPGATAGLQDVIAGKNIVPFRPLQFVQNTRFRLIVSRENGTVIPASQVRLSVASSDRLLLNYARHPKRMITDEHRCEFPNEYNSAIYERAKIEFFEKLNIPSRNKPNLTQYWQVYNSEINKIKNYQYTQGEDGVYDIQVDSQGEFRDYANPGKRRWTPFYGFHLIGM